ncbi:hypothetical protein [Polynucleobacter sp.]|uniref:hypothetical protein n=1 Tax=Polynucleobacter sp. TaxID=2029855 RepID=UPI003F697EBC
MNLIPIINNREDLDHLIDTPEHDQFMEYLKGSITRKQDTAIYPESYGQPGYEGPAVEPVWTDIEDLSTITRFGFTKADFQ